MFEKHPYKYISPKKRVISLLYLNKNVIVLLDYSFLYMDIKYVI